MELGPVAGSTAAAANNGIGLQDFLRILLTQLSFQDPLKPMDNQAFMAQMAQFASLEQTQRLNVNLEQLLASQSALQSVGLIGRMVDVTTASGSMTGTVVSLSLAGQVPLLAITTGTGTVLSDVALSQVAAVR
jgi:flagellar basal-body rod modification protein FlgD